MAAPPNYGPLFGRFRNEDYTGHIPPVEPESFVRVYSQSMQMSIAQQPAMDGTKASAFGSATVGPSGAVGYGANAKLDPPLSPSPVPLRGYASAPLQPAPAVHGRISPVNAAKAEERDREYRTMMTHIRETQRQQNAANEQDEDRRIERLLQHIEEEEKFVAQVDRSLRMHEEARHKRRHELCKEWHDKVYYAIQAQIDQQLAALPTHELSARRRALLEDFITTSNRKKGGLYRDIIIESDYDPMVAHKTALKYGIADYADPLKQELLKPSPSGKTVVPKRGGRATLSCAMWDRLHATPYGRFDRMDKFAAENPPKVDPNRLSRINLEHYNVSRDPAVLDREFPRGKRIQFGDFSSGDMRKSNIFESVVPVEAQ